MYFTKFHIENFKGIRSMDLDLSEPGAGIFTLIGLNESGKTTILEALASPGKRLHSADLSALASSHPVQRAVRTRIITLLSLKTKRTILPAKLKLLQH